MFYAGENVCTNPGRRISQQNFSRRSRRETPRYYLTQYLIANPVFGSWHSLPGHCG